KVYGTVEKFKAMLVIQRFKQKLGRDYFDTYAPVAHISTIRLLIAMASIHSLIIHQMDVKTTFLNGNLDEEVDLTNEFLSSRFSMKDMGEANVILALRKLSKYTSNPGTQHWQAIQRVLKYLKKTMDYRLTYTGYPSVLEGYTDASWISNTEDNSSTSGWNLLIMEDEVVNFSMANFFEKVLSRSMNKEESPILITFSKFTLLWTEGIHQLISVKAEGSHQGVTPSEG
ncbi:zinc finger, CCHC-type containing protein, partial [Tanacetum coccineum]